MTRTKKREFALESHERPVGVNSYWDGGSKSDYLLYDYKVDRWLPMNTNPGFPLATNRSHELLPGQFILETGTFCGKPATATFHCRVDEVDAVKDYLMIVTPVSG